MSWTRRVSHPGELLMIGQEIDLVVLHVDRQREVIDLSIKQTERNPWQEMGARVSVGTVVEGRVIRITAYGALVEVEPNIVGLVHRSNFSWTRKISRPGEVLSVGQSVHCVILSISSEKQRLELGIRQLQPDPWLRDIPSRYHAGEIVRGRVAKLAGFGVFVELEPELQGLLHRSELAGDLPGDPSEIMTVGQEIRVRVLRVDPDHRRIALSQKLIEDCTS